MSRFTAWENIQTYGSSDWAERGFCKTCGTNIYYQLKQSGDYSLAAGLFGEEVNFKFEEQIFIDKKPDYYAFANQTEELTEAEVMAKFGA